MNEEMRIFKIEILVADYEIPGELSPSEWLQSLLAWAASGREIKLGADNFLKQALSFKQTAMRLVAEHE
jgi:hypothetical protein